MTDDWLMHEPRVDAFVDQVRRIFRQHAPIEDRLAEARPLFRELLLQDGWLPPAFAERDCEGGMGEGIGTWLMFRSGEGDMGSFRSRGLTTST